MKYRGDRPNGWRLCCPLGHVWFYVGETEKERLERRLNEERDRAARLAADLDQTQASLRAQKGVTTKLRKRAAAGVCPAYVPSATTFRDADEVPNPQPGGPDPVNFLSELRLKVQEDAGRYDTDAPWVIWHFLSTDLRTRITGRSIIQMQCAVCGKRERLRFRIPRVGPVPLPKTGKHPVRLRFIRDHLHPDKGHPMSWAKPLLNPDAHRGGMDLNLLAMRLEADLNEAIRGA